MEVEPPKRAGKKMKNMDKPWEDDSVDHWKTEAFDKGDMSSSLTEESSFAVLFPTYREQYLRETWPQVTSILKEHGIACQLDLIEGSMTVKTTRKTWDPYIILKARDMIKLLARSVNLQQAKKILEDDVAADILKIGTLCPNKERFIKRRDRLLGPNGSTLKAIELLTSCYVMVQGNTVACMGPYKGLKQVRKLVEDCMRNFHPVYHIKALMIRRELEKDPTLANESWERFLPKFKKNNSKRPKRPKKSETDKAVTPFPPAQTPRKVDLQLESGEYFLNQEQKRAKELERRSEQQAEGTKAAQERRNARFKAPKEGTPLPTADAAPAAPAAAELVASIKGLTKAATKRPAPDAPPSKQEAKRAKQAEIAHLLPEAKKHKKGLKKGKSADAA